MNNDKWNIRVHAIGGVNVAFRTWVDKMFEGVPSTAEQVVVDFDAVQFISRSAAHQMVLERDKLTKKGVDVQFVNTHEDVNRMLDIVEATKYASAPVPQNIPVIEFSKFKEMEMAKRK